jgi:pSer/pThr/pTyr-binding forkhead associated (FHA) protein
MKLIPRLHIAELGRPERIVEVIGATTIGRDDDNDLVLAEATVSRCHALLLALSEDVALIDLDSANGAFVNGVQAPPDEAVRLADGDVITLGRVVAHYYCPIAEPSAVSDLSFSTPRSI